MDGQKWVESGELTPPEGSGHVWGMRVLLSALCVCQEPCWAASPGRTQTLPCLDCAALMAQDQASSREAQSEHSD